MPASCRRRGVQQLLDRIHLFPVNIPVKRRSEGGGGDRTQTQRFSRERTQRKEDLKAFTHLPVRIFPGVNSWWKGASGPPSPSGSRRCSVGLAGFRWVVRPRIVPPG